MAVAAEDFTALSGGTGPRASMLTDAAPLGPLVSAFSETAKTAPATMRSKADSFCRRPNGDETGSPERILGREDVRARFHCFQAMVRNRRRSQLSSECNTDGVRRKPKRLRHPIK
jgi:hypothetical protein